MRFLISLYILISSVTVWANKSEQPVVGRKAAQTYFQKREPAEESGSSSNGSSARYLALHFGTYTSSVAYKWGGDEKLEDIATRSYGVTYRVGEWTNSMDLQFRIDFNDFEIDDQYIQKLSFIPMVTFPDAASNFPLYFGAGIGAGVFFRQINKESSLSLDYQLLMGARFLDIYNGAGFFIETGLKNHLHILSDGQLNGTFLSGGAVFEF